MKQVYNLHLYGATYSGNPNTFSFTIDLKKLIPLSNRSKKYIVYSSFHTWAPFTAGARGSIIVWTNMPFSRMYKKWDSLDTSNWNIPNYIICGIALAQTVYSVGNFVFNYEFPECIPFMIEYPDYNYTDSFNVILQPGENVNFTAVGTMLDLKFVEVDDEVPRPITNHYTLRFTGLADGTSARYTKTFNYDIKNLLPLSFRNKKIRVTSSFFGTSNLQGYSNWTHGWLICSNIIKFPDKHSLYSTYITDYNYLGIAYTFSSSISLNYSVIKYGEEDSIEYVIDYDELPDNQIILELIHRRAPPYTNASWEFDLHFYID